MEKRAGILGVPLGYGAGQTGSELGANAMRLSLVRGRQLADHIRELGYEVTDHGNVRVAEPSEPSSNDNPKYLAEMLESSRSIISAVDRILKAGEIPIILGGDHAIAIPTFSAISAHHRSLGADVGLIWFDAHADINTPETSPSGNIHGMPLAALLGRGASELTGLCDFSPKLKPQFFAHIGARDLDAGERAQVESFGLRSHFFTMSDVDRRGMTACVEEAIRIASAAPGGFAVTFDIDSIDPVFAPGSGTLVRGGFTYREAHLALEIIAENYGLLSFEIVEVNPLLDQSNITVELAVELILSALGKTIL